MMDGEGELVAVLKQVIEATNSSQASGDVCKNEKAALARFCQLYQEQRCFTPPQCPEQDARNFQLLVRLLKKYRITTGWLMGVVNQEEQSGHAHMALMALRLLLRDPHLHQVLMTKEDPLPALTQCLLFLVESHFSAGQKGQSHTDLLKEATNIFQKLSNCVEYRQRLVDRGVHSLLVQLLWSHDLVPLQCALCALINLCKTDTVSACVSSLNCAPPLLHIITSYDTVSQHLASDLLLLLSQHSALRDQIRDSDSLPQCLKVLHSEDTHLLHRMVGVVERLLESSHYQEEVRLLGGIPLLLGLLCKHTSGSQSGSRDKSVEERVVALRAVCCAALTQLVLNDANSQLIIQGNGVYLIATNILPLRAASSDGGLDSRPQENLQRYALRALRYLFSMERNRKIFKKLFPPNLFESFIDIGHYSRSLSAYNPLLHTINTLTESERAVMQTNIEAINQNKAPIFSIEGYSVLELLGSGAFGRVYKVHKQNTNTFYALKEIRCNHPALGHTQDERSSSIGRILNEVNIIQEQLKHPNVVRYYKCFQEGEHVYIVMELLEGTSLIDHVNSLAERGSKFTEARIWKIFLQLVLALRYLHKEKRVVHRDLSPANLMLSEEDKLTITDFGLAKQKQQDVSVMKSVVGTVLYWCPELVQSEPYNEKADVWAAGCILYLMATLKPPFHSTNLLALAKKIAEVDYQSIPEGQYSPLLDQVVTRCLTADPQLRPDTVELGGMLAGLMMAEYDSLALSNESLERRLVREKQKTFRHAVSAERRYQQLLSTPAPFPGPAHTSHACRQLSMNLDPTTVGRSYSIGSVSAWGEGEATPTLTNPLQNSSDSVFMDNPTHDRLLGNWEQPSSPQVLPRGSGRPNPLTSHIPNIPTSASAGDIPASFRRVSLPGHIPITSWSVGPHSPLAKGHKSRTPSASSLSISPKHLREISDPILVLLTQLHKLVFLAQLPPSPAPSARWRLVQQYERCLFQPGSSPSHLKTQLHKLVSASADTVAELGGGAEEGEGLGSRLVQRALQELGDRGRYIAGESRLTYETLQELVEGLALEHGYYQRTTPLNTPHNS